MTPEIESRLEQTQSLPTLPGVALRIVELGEDPDVDPSLVVDAISRDPALTAKILRAANSPIYVQQRKATTLREAVMALGLESTLTLALGFTLVRSLQGGSGRLNYPAFWRRAIVCGAAAQCFGEHNGCVNLEELLLAGLLQDIGMLVLDAVMPYAYGQLVAESPDHEGLVFAERRLLGTDHAEVGCWVMRRWGLPDYLIRAAAGSHDLECRRESEEGGEAAASDGPCASSNQVLIRAVALSSRMADVWVTNDAEAAAVQAASLADDFFGWDQEVFGALMGRVTTLVGALTHVYEVEFRSLSELVAVSERAREMLTLRSLQVIHEAASAKRRSQELEAENSVLQQQVEHDPLTELHNRRHLANHLSKAFDAAADRGESLALALVDLDHFKRVNDEFGHQVGDAVLYRVAQLLRQEVGKGNILARYGGEEFLVALPGLGEIGALAVLERLRKAIAGARYVVEQQRIDGISVSIGYAVHDPQRRGFEDLEALIRAADRTLYQAKRNGRNRVEQWHENG